MKEQKKNTKGKVRKTNVKIIIRKKERNKRKKEERKKEKKEEKRKRKERKKEESDSRNARRHTVKCQRPDTSPWTRATLFLSDNIRSMLSWRQRHHFKSD